ncbi:hypothetical protein A3C23_04760 [Candidatus Roizmanbacteria bacterium RIFCSPHIGHO2_02_FULL_37_13b]|uniref:Glutaredoxin domain-containing protein n=1 Tax=Candidatus Roizmanbacteria bacterium RIFCSPLOWO2_02_FULL_36_11 TaxID=1802071 RepID=A0A1F7JHT5_9BACT|nr:MAG: hypothetical protein A3C23_04760 [Candidatus Roizmanbacteria bacterium RIFCSPHIGHO2_02_FULL_37_13b]OGK55162.1 MAG: hypothetical protein A3H78_05875 [Candidatus Roizmanbacteria bacterium RIFCSPLOWO2_02_FULL_36_11]
MKSTIYTITNCPFCKAEKDYLTANKLTFEEKNLEEHREFLAEMLDLSEKWAGVPFTVILKDDGSQVKLKGFTKEEFDKAFGLIPTEESKSAGAPAGAEKTTPPAKDVVVPDEKLQGVMDNLTKKAVEPALMSTMPNVATPQNITDTGSPVIPQSNLPSEALVNGIATPEPAKPVMPPSTVTESAPLNSPVNEPINQQPVSSASSSQAPAADQNPHPVIPDLPQ